MYQYFLMNFIRFDCKCLMRKVLNHCMFRFGCCSCCCWWWWCHYFYSLARLRFNDSLLRRCCGHFSLISLFFPVSPIVPVHLLLFALSTFIWLLVFPSFVYLFVYMSTYFRSLSLSLFLSNTHSLRSAYLLIFHLLFLNACHFFIVSPVRVCVFDGHFYYFSLLIIFSIFNSYNKNNNENVMSTFVLVGITFVCFDTFSLWIYRLIRSSNWTYEQKIWILHYNMATIIIEEKQHYFTP